MSVEQRLRALSSGAVQGMRRGIEKESLRVKPDGTLAQTLHPPALGAALTHPHITTDFSESQLELITGVHASVESCLEELTQIHQAVYRHIGDEVLWCASMPCNLPADHLIPIGRYGISNVGRAKTVYRLGLATTSSPSSRREHTTRRTRRRCAWGAWATRATRRPRSA
jgi:glutamate--cysteine ligase